MSTGRVTPPHVTDINAYMNPGRTIQGSGEVKTFELLGVKFSEGTEKRVGAVGNGLDLETKTPILNPMRWLFDSPANIEAAVDAAYYDAIDRSNADGIISTRVKAEKTGFTFLHIIGWGTANAEIIGREVKIVEGQLHRSSRDKGEPDMDSNRRYSSIIPPVRASVSVAAGVGDRAYIGAKEPNRIKKSSSTSQENTRRKKSR